MTDLIPPYGGTLCELLVPPEERPQALARAAALPSITLDARQLCDLELLLNGGFSPLDRLHGPRRLRAVLRRDAPRRRHALADADHARRRRGVRREARAGATTSRCATAEGVLLAVARTSRTCWQPDREREASAVFGTDDTGAPGRALPARPGRQPVYLGGRLEGLELAAALRLPRSAPHAGRAARRVRASSAGAASSPSRPATRCTARTRSSRLRAAQAAEANLLIHPVVGMTKPGDVDHYTRVRCYQALLPHYPAAARRCSRCCRSPCAWRGPREAVWHAHHPQELRLHPLHRRPRPRRPRQRRSGQAVLRPLRRAGAGRSSTRTSSASTMVPFQEMVYVGGPRRSTCPRTRSRARRRRARRSRGTELRRRLSRGRSTSPTGSPSRGGRGAAPHAIPPRHRQGFTVFFTGLSRRRQVDHRQRAAGRSCWSWAAAR